MHLSKILAAAPATTVLSPPYLGASPLPTPGPRLEIRDLAPREIGADTCGWVNAQSGM